MQVKCCSLLVFLVCGSAVLLLVYKLFNHGQAGSDDVCIPGYELVHTGVFRDLTVKPTVVHVCFYVRASINSSLRSDLSLDQLENLDIEIAKPNSKPFLIVNWYRPPDSTVDKFDIFETLIRRTLDAENVEYHLMGDLNW